MDYRFLPVVCFLHLCFFPFPSLICSISPSLISSISPSLTCSFLLTYMFVSPSLICLFPFPFAYSSILIHVLPFLIYILPFLIYILPSSFIFFHSSLIHPHLFILTYSSSLIHPHLFLLSYSSSLILTYPHSFILTSPLDIKHLVLVGHVISLVLAHKVQVVNAHGRLAGPSCDVGKNFVQAPLQKP